MTDHVPLCCRSSTANNSPDKTSECPPDQDPHRLADDHVRLKRLARSEQVPDRVRVLQTLEDPNRAAQWTAYALPD
jgi:hypothetical protein